MTKTLYILSTLAVMLVVSRFVVRIVDATVQIDNDIGMLLLLLLPVNAETGRCAGCRGPNDNKPEFCSERCGIILCEKRKSNGYLFCDECPDSAGGLVHFRQICYIDDQSPAAFGPAGQKMMKRKVGHEKKNSCFIDALPADADTASRCRLCG